MGHGHVIPNPDGSRARCGGPGICSECALEAAQLDAEIKKIVVDVPLHQPYPQIQKGKSEMTPLEARFRSALESISIMANSQAAFGIIREVADKALDVHAHSCQRPDCPGDSSCVNTAKKTE